MNEIEQHYGEVLEKIALSAGKSGRAAEDITLVAVTKTVDAGRINEALKAGARHIGENRVQEILEKVDKLDKNYDFSIHLIGQLQRNKVKYIIDKVNLIHSLDRLSLAEEIERQCELKDKSMDCLIQVNISKEDTKSGIYEEDIMPLIEGIDRLPRVRVCGLMTIAPFTDREEDIRMCFSKCRTLFDKLSQYRTDRFDMKYLSMGMSGDFEIAIEEGANIVRIGSAIFGRRNY